MSMMVKIYDTESSQEIARKIYESFDVMASCTIYGFIRNDQEETIIERGEEVLKHLRLLDAEENINYLRGGKSQRKYKYKENAIGGPLAHKIFTWERRIVDKEPRYTIWRFQ